MPEAVAPEKGGWNSLKAAVGGIASRLPLVKRAPVEPDPFSDVQDDPPFRDVLSTPDAAPGRVENKGRERVDTALGSAVKSPPILIFIVAILAFLLALVITGIIVASPPKHRPTAAPLTPKGEALVRTWLPPPGDPLEPKMAFQREGEAKYTAEDAAKLGINPDPRLSSSLRVKNDEAIDDLFGTVP